MACLLLYVLCLFLSPVFSQPTQELIDEFSDLYAELEQPLAGKERIYHVAIDQVIWDFVPDHWDYIQDTALETSSSKEWTVSCKSSTAVGSRYYKAQYREYTDDSYTELSHIPSWQGGMGPILRGEVGDTLVVHVWNRAQHNFSMHPHGVFYEFEMEGAVYKNTDSKAFIAPGQRYTYRWTLHPRAGPGPTDGASLVWGYHSHVHESDIYAGLYGAILVYRQGHLSDSVRQSQRQEIVTTVFASDENASPFLEQTLDDLAPQLDHQALQHMTGDPTPFFLSNIKQMINGRMLYEPRMLTFHQGEPVDWHILAWGSFIDLLEISWESGQVLYNDQQVGHLTLFPASFRTVTFTPDQPGYFTFGALNQPAAQQGMVWRCQVL
ncbi:Cupredoxin [Hesseltinella vesiculosa]|uniref:Cupredoxin n=1 Tax=Hesseltinella vesiculosa TaxID=101127 RepID=A0A1X2G5H0_9FUNG|nr:Cupredoxin [Hesseltinella vesiculosa]